MERTTEDQRRRKPIGPVLMSFQGEVGSESAFHGIVLQLDAGADYAIAKREAQLAFEEYRWAGGGMTALARTYTLSA